MKRSLIRILCALFGLVLLLCACNTSPDAPSTPESQTKLETEPESQTEAPSVTTQTETEAETETETEAITKAETETVIDTDTETETETEAETEPSPSYLIPDPTRLDLSTFPPELFEASFAKGTAAYPEQCANGVQFFATREHRTPTIKWNISNMYQAAGYPIAEDGSTYVPFTPDEIKVIVFKLQAEWGGAFELFYKAGQTNNKKKTDSLIEIYGGDSEFFGERVSQYVIFEADENTKNWDTRFYNGFVLGYSNYVAEGDVLLLEQIAFCADRAEAEAYIAADRGEIPPVPAVPAGYYVCLYEDRLHLPDGNIKGEVMSSLDQAIELCDQSKQFGYRVANEKGEIVYTPYSLLQSNLLREGKYITAYAKKEKFKYGDSCTNPGINHRPHRTSCDRLVDWILYRAGFTDQPLVQGCVVSNLVGWCEKMGFEKITDINDLQPGDIIFVRPASDGGPQHTFMLASTPEDGQALRYDHGSDQRIMSKKHPSKEPVSYADAPFMYAYRPVATEENNIYYDQLYSD